jgi:outer membrane protein assembly factor BamB
MKKILFILIVASLVLISCIPVNNPPTQPTNPSPSNGETGVSITPTLSWEASDPDGDTLTFDVYFGTDSSPTLAKSNLTTKTYSPGNLESDTTYYWKVVAKDGKGGETEGPLWSFKTGNYPPTQPSNPAPINGATDVSLTPTLSWESSDPDGDTLTFDVYFGIDSNPTLVESDLSTNTYNPGLLNPLTTYYWKIVAKDGKGRETEGPIWSFETENNNPPSQPSNPSPSDGANNISLTPILSWAASDPDGDSLTFDVYFGTETDPPLVESKLTTNTYKPATLNSATTYYWKIVVKDGKGGVTEGPVWSFTTTNPPIAPSNPTPSNGATNISLTPTLSWEASDPDGDTLTYNLYLSTEASPELYQEGIETNSIEVGPLENGTTYYWRVEAKDGKGGVTSSPIWSFTTTNPPTQPTNPSPSDEQTNVSLNPTLSWEASDPDGDTVTFDIYFGTNSNPSLVESDLSTNTYNPGTLNSKVTYYWKVVAKDGKGSETEGPIWSFTTLEEGTVKWEYNTGIILSCPAIGPDGTIYIGSMDHNLYAIRPDGTLKWKFSTYSVIDSSPAIGPDCTIYVGSWDQYLYAINPDGSLKWKFQTNDWVDSSPAIGADGTIYVGSDDDYLYAINPDGSLKWKFYAYGPDTSPAIGPDGTIYVASTYLFAINPNGTLKWSFPVSVIDSSPAIGSDGTIYVGSDDFYLYAINPDGSLKWKFFTNYTISNSSPAIGPDGTIYVGSWDQYLYAINPDGSLKWKFQTNDWVDSSPAIGADGTIYVGSDDDYLYAINPDGSLKWKIYGINNSPAIDSDGTIYVGGTFDLYAVTSASEGLANSPWPKFSHDNQNSGNFNHEK